METLLHGQREAPPDNGHPVAWSILGDFWEPSPKGGVQWVCPVGMLPNRPTGAGAQGPDDVQDGSFSVRDRRVSLPGRGLAGVLET